MIIKNHSPVPTILMDESFDDMGEYGKRIGWDLEFRQMDAGRLEARGAVMASPTMAAIRVELSRGFHQAGHAPTDAWTFGLPDLGCGQFRWCGRLARGGDILNFNGRNGFEGVSPAGFSGYTLSIPGPVMKAAFMTCGINRAQEMTIRETGSWTGRTEFTQHLRQRFALAYRDPRTATELFRSGMVFVLLSSIACGELQAGTLLPAGRKRLVDRAIEIIRSPEFAPQSVSGLCELLQVSGPTLYRAFMDCTGVSPKQYMQLRLLNGARNDLLNTRPGSKVYEIANRWGFWHMGQFSSDYKKLFGESPSETLAS